MAKSKGKKQRHLNKRQRLVIDDLFESGLAEAEVLAKHKVSVNTFRKWLRAGPFAQELSFRIESARRQSELIIARFAPVAAAKLVELATDSKEETARKACLDIISSPTGQKSQVQESVSSDEPLPSAAEQLSPETASRLLAALAEQKNRQV